MREPLELLKRYLTQKVVKWVIKKLLIAIAPYALPLLGIFLIWYVVYSTFFYLPNKFLEKTGTLAFFTTGDKEWDLAKDKSLRDTYDQLTDTIGSKDSQERTPSMYDQAFPYKVPWSLLASIDRLLGDPITNDKIHRKPQPKEHYQAIKPILTWRDSVVTVTECDDDGQCTTTNYTVKLLDQAETYDTLNKLSYTWKEDVGKHITVKHEVLTHVDRTDLDHDHNRLYLLLKKYGFSDQEYKLVQELSASYTKQSYLKGYAGNVGNILDPGNGEYNNYWKINKEAFNAGQRYINTVSTISKAIRDKGMPDSWIMPMVELSGRESSWNQYDQNPTSTAYGLFQFLEKTWKNGKTSDAYYQTLEAIDYIRERYGSPINALRFWDVNQWY